METNQNFLNNVYVDVGNTCIKFGFYKSKKFVIKKIKCDLFDYKSFIRLFKNNINNNLHFYISSVNNKYLIRLSKIISKKNIKYTVFDHNNLNELKKLFTKNINFNQIGIDLIFCSYYLNEYKDILICLFGTVFVFIKKTSKIDGFLFIPNLDIIFSNLIKQININDVDIKTNINKFNKCDLFGTSNQVCFNNSINYLFNYFLSGIINDTGLKNLIVSGGNKKFFIDKNLNKNLNIKYIDEIVVLGIKKFVEKE